MDKTIIALTLLAALIVILAGFEISVSILGLEISIHIPSIFDLL